MARILPTDADLYLLLSVIFLFLAINYNLPLSTIYGYMTIILLLGYLIPIMFSLFRWIPLSKDGNILLKIGVGCLFGWGFVQFYNSVTATPMAAIFATTLLGDSKIMTQAVYSGLIPPIESIFFFVILLGWWAWKIGDSIHVSPFSMTGIKMMIAFGAIFTLFHATAKGIENTTDLAMTFAFGALSVGMVLHFQEAIQAIVMHMFVNGWAMKIFAAIQEVTANSTWVIIGGVALIMFLISKDGFSLKKFAYG